MYLILSGLMLAVIGSAPLTVGGWLFGYTKRTSLGFGIAFAGFAFWTFVFAFTRNHTDPSWGSIWLTMLALFLVPALLGAFLSEYTQRRRGRRDD